MESSEEQILGKVYDAMLMRRLLAYIIPYRRSAFLALACLLAGSGFSIIQPYLTKIAIDRYIRTNDSAGLSHVAWLYVATLALAFGLSFA